MPGFSNSVLQVIDRFAQDMGVEARPAADKSFSFAFSHSGVVTFTSSDDGRRVIVSMARNPRMPESAQERKFLMLAGFDPSSNRFIHAGQSEDGSLIASVSIDEREFGLSEVDAIFQRLDTMFEHADVY